MDSQTNANPYSLTSALQHANESAGRKSWKSRLDFLSPGRGDGRGRGGNDLNQTNTNTSAGAKYLPKWWKVRLFRGMINDVRRRAPFYWSDWRDAWDYRVLPATVYMYFAKYVK
jgi:hypothetical protein